MLTVLRPRPRQITGRDFDALDEMTAAGRDVILDAAGRACVNGGELLETLEQIFELKWQSRTLADAGCDAFDAEARRLGLDPVAAAEDLETAHTIEELPEVRETFDQSDIADTAARELDREWRDDQHRVLAELHNALAGHVELCQEPPVILMDAAPDRTVAAALEAASRWLPAAFVDGEEKAHLAWREWQHTRPTGTGIGSWWARFFQPGTGSRIGLALIDDFEIAFYDLQPQLAPPVGCQFVASENFGNGDAAASYRDWPRPTISYRRGSFSAGTCMHELAHWIEARLRPELSQMQHTLLRLRQRSDITSGRPAWSAQSRIPAQVLDPYQECWYAQPWETPHAFEVLSTTLAKLAEQRHDVLHDPKMLSACLGGLVACA
jgi:hypothetical protein